MLTNSSKFRARGALSWLGALALGAAALASGCTSTDSPVGAQTGGSGAGSSGAPGGAGTGRTNTAGSVSSGGMLGSAGAGGSSAGAAGLSGMAGMAGSVACAPDDECCDDPLKTAPGECGCGKPDADGDKDGTLDCKEECPFDANKVEKGECGCELTDNDSDDDGEIDCQPGHYFEAEDGVLSEVDAPVTPVETGEGGAGGGGAVGAGGAPGSLGFSIGEAAEASKEKFLESPAGVIADGLPGPARASYEIDAPVAGTYRVWVRLYTPDRDHNRVWVRVDNGTWMKLRATTGETWFWYAFHKDGEFDMPIAYELTKGMHTLTIASNTDGVRIDRFYVTPGLDKPPGDVTTCNPPHTIESAGVCLNSCGGLMGNSCDAVLCAGKTLLPAYDCEVCCKL
jgi:hypothetical protein